MVGGGGGGLEQTAFWDVDLAIPVISPWMRGQGAPTCCSSFHPVLSLRASLLPVPLRLILDHACSVWAGKSYISETQKGCTRMHLSR